MATTIRRPVLATDFDLQALETIFRKHKRSTLEYGDLRNRLMKDFPRMTNDRQNDLVDYLVDRGVIEKMAYGKWRLIEQEKPAVTSAKPEPPPPAQQPSSPAQPPSSPAKRGLARGDLMNMLRDYVRERPGVTAAEAAKFLEIDALTASAMLGATFRNGRLRRAKQTNPSGRGICYRYYPLDSTQGDLSPVEPATTTQGEASREAVYEYVKAHPRQTSHEIAAGLHVSLALAQLRLKGLVDANRVSRTAGPRGAFTYAVGFSPAAAREAAQAVQAATPLPPLGDRLVEFVRENPGAGPMAVARHFHMSEESARDYLNLTYLNGRLRRIRVDAGRGRWYFEYYAPDHPAVQNLNSPSSQQLGGVPKPTPVRVAGEPPKPAMQVAMEKANVVPAARKGIVLAPLIYTIQVKVELDNPAIVEALQHLEEVAECQTMSVESARP